MADDQITIDPEFGPQREGFDPEQRRSLRRFGLTLVVVLVLIFGWLLRSVTPDAPEAVWDPLTVTTVIAQEATPPSTAPPESPFLVGIFVWGGFEAPNDLVIDASGVLFVSEAVGERVRTASIQTGLHANEWAIVASGIPDAEGLAVSDDGVLFISGESAVYSVSEGHATVALVGGFNDPAGLAIDASDDLYVADNVERGIRISKVEILPDGTGAPPVLIGTVPGESAADMEFGPNGGLFVANSLDAVWVIEFGEDGSVNMRPFATLDGQRALAFDESGMLYSAGGDDAIIWSIDPQGAATVIARGLRQVEGLAVDPSGILYISDVRTNQILRIDPTPIDASRALKNPSTITPDMAGALSGDDGSERLLRGAVGALPPGPRLDFLQEYCEPGCFRDAVAVSSDDSTIDVEGPSSDERFYVRHGFINNSAEPLGDEFDVVMYLTRWSGPALADGSFELVRTYRFVSDYSLRGTTEQCGPTYRTQTEPQTCEWFVHDFPHGIPAGRYDLWAEWQAPCSSWIGLGFTESCDSADEVVSFFSSGVNSAFGWD